MPVQKIKYNSKEYKEAVALRNLILRQPLGLRLDKKDLVKEEHDIHIGCFEEHQLVGTLVMTAIDRDTVKIRQVAVAEDHQRKGIGRALMTFAEKIAKKHEFSNITLNARTSALPFYLKMGYTTVGKEYISKNTNLPHFKMTKHIPMEK